MSETREVLEQYLEARKAWDRAERLRIAAPDMYEALKRLEALVRIVPPEMDEPGSALAQARAALAKADGNG